MKKLYSVLSTFLWCTVGAFICRCIYQIYDYIHYRELYETYSAPWYTGILLSTVITAMIVIICLILMYFIKRKIHKTSD